MPRIRSSALVAAVIALLLVGLGIWMIVAGWPLETPRQIALMDLSQLPMSAAVLVAIVEMIWERQPWRRRRAAGFAAVFAPGAILLLTGLVMMVVAFALPARHLTGAAQLLIWTGLGIAFCYLAVDSVRRELREARPQLEPLDDDELDDLWDDLEDGDDDPDGGDDDDGYGSYRARPLFDPNQDGPGPASLQ